MVEDDENELSTSGSEKIGKSNGESGASDQDYERTNGVSQKFSQDELDDFYQKWHTSF